MTTTSPSRGVVTDSDIRPYLDFVSATATRLAGTRRARQAGAEYDDLYQEGLLAVWISLSRGANPRLPVSNRMKDYITFMAKLRRNDGGLYGELLPLEPGGPAPGGADLPA